MNFRRSAFRLLRVYFWVLVVATLFAVVLALDRFVVAGDIVATGWFAAVGLGAVVLVFLIVIGRAAR